MRNRQTRALGEDAQPIRVLSLVPADAPDIRDGSTETFRESVRAYTADELTAVFRGAGLAVEATWGDFEGGPAGGDSPRLIVLARKPC